MFLDLEEGMQEPPWPASFAVGLPQAQEVEVLWRQKGGNTEGLLAPSSGVGEKAEEMQAFLKILLK